MSEFTGQAVIVTGGESGIGRAIAEAFAAQGAAVTIGGVIEDRAEEALAAIAEAGGKAEFVKTDVSRWDDIDRLVSETIARRGRLDVMVNNAGVFDGFASCLDTTEALWDRVIDINLKGQFFGCKRSLQHMVPAGYGRIINISSVGGLKGSADGTSYTASKFGVIGLTKQIACTYAAKGITVNAVCPGVVQTPIRANSAAILGSASPDMQQGVGADPDAYKRVVPAERRGRPQEVAALALYLASQIAGYITGQAMAIDGGWTAT
ncbi:MAG TPA: SDR family NAD(P)-dependent oxidoreductase [Aestuariivirgaceae bacterium]|nr:SDR family NAD(P)-dependent oxidoreductase [Aestuariivirgaceae bacterium]